MYQVYLKGVLYTSNSDSHDDNKKSTFHCKDDLPVVNLRMPAIHGAKTTKNSIARLFYNQTF